METVSYQLQEMIRINRQILNRLNKDEATLEYIQNAFDERGIYTAALVKKVSEIEAEQLTEKEKKILNSLFERFNKQSNKIQKALDLVIRESQARLEDAVKRRKAEEGYTVLK